MVRQRQASRDTDEAETDVIKRDEDVDEEKIEEMIELEEELLSSRRECDEQTDTTSTPTPEQTDATADREEVTGTIRNARKERRHIMIEFFAEGETWEHRIPFPDDPSNPKATINRLCRLCNVPEGRVADLQGASVPVKKDGEQYKLCIPSTATRPSLAVFHAWWWLRRRQSTIPKRVRDTASTIGTIVGLGVPYLLGMHMLIVAVTTQPTPKIPEATGIVLPFLTAGTFTGSLEIIGGLLGMLLIVFAACSLMITGAAVLVAGIVVKNYLEDRVNPF